MRFVRVKRVGAVERDVEEAHSFKIDFQDGDIATKACGHSRGVDAGCASANHDHTTRQDAGNATEQDAAAAAMLSEKVSANEHGHAAGNFAHRFKQWQSAIHFDSFVSERGHA